MAENPVGFLQRRLGVSAFRNRFGGSLAEGE